MYLLVGIDTEGDNQWDAAARAHQPFDNIYALPRLHELFARHGVRPTYVITYPVATDPRSADVLRGLVARRRLRNRRASPRVGNAAVHRGGRRAACVRLDAAAASVRAAARRADRGDRGGRGRAAGVVPIGPLRVLGRSRRRARAAGISGRIERRAAVLRVAQGRTGVRGGAADAVLPRVRQRHAAGQERRAGGARVVRRLNRRLPRPSAVRLCTCAAALHDQTRFAGAAARAHALAAAIVLFAGRHDLARARPRARREPVLNLLFHSSEAIVGGSPYNRTRRSSTRSSSGWNSF